ncbi:MAG: hydrogenase 4 membrane subunit [Coriobacteriales bacterium]|jgi:hydrogenase-4 component E|nr:hydrogenase 4 membrane subunit [Coriobacteriales bacterium]
MNGFIAVNVLGGLLIITSLMVTLTKTVRRTAYVYAIQSLILIGVFISLGVLTGSSDLFTWSITAFITKVLIVPGVLLFVDKKLNGSQPELKPKISSVYIVLLVAVEVLICYVVVQNIQLPTSIDVKPALAVSLAHFFIGLTCIAVQRNILKQVLGYCLMENGAHLTLALLAPNAPGLVEIGVTTDAFFAVIIMAVVAYRVYKTHQSLSADDLNELKG